MRSGGSIITARELLKRFNANARGARSGHRPMTFGEELYADFQKNMRANPKLRHLADDGFEKRDDTDDDLETQIDAENGDDDDGAELRALNEEGNAYNRKYPKGVSAADPALVEAWVKKNPDRALSTPREHVEEEVINSERARGIGIAKRIAFLETKRAQGPAVDAVMSKAAAYSAHVKTPDAIAGLAEWERLKQREHELIERNDTGAGLTAAERRERDRLSHAILGAWSRAFEPRVSPARERIA